MAEKKKSDVKHKGILTIEKNVNETQDRATALWVVQWIIDGGAKNYRNLEKREFYKDTAGEWKMGKSKGINLHDALIIEKRWGEVMLALGSKLPEHQPKQETGDAQEPGNAPADVPPAAKQEDGF